MTPMLVLAASLIAAFLTWYACGPITHIWARGIARAFFIALFCSPVLIVGHGFAVVPSLFGLAVQPSVYSIGPMFVVWVLAIGLVLGVAPLRNHSNPWPPSLTELFLTAPRTKMLLLGILTAVLMTMLLFADDSDSPAIVSAQFGLFFAGSAENLVLCYWLVRRRGAGPFVIPVYFALPGLAAAAPIVPLVWYGGGLLGALVGSGRVQLATWLSTAIFGLLVANALVRAYSASVAPTHVSIQGGVAGNIALAIGFAGLGLAAWYVLRWIRASRPH